MIAALLLVATLQQTPGLQLVTSLDRDHLPPGDELTVVIKAIGASGDPITVNVPASQGLMLVGRTERTEIEPGSPARRVTTLELRFRAETPGQWRLGPFLARQVGQYVQGDALLVTVEGSGSAASAALTPGLKRLLDRAAPPRGLGEAAVTVMISPDSVVVGDQVDVVTIAWFDREVRQELRRAPSLDPPRIEGVWSYPQPAPGGIAASRVVDGKWYDLFVLHQVIFPLSAGPVRVGPAELEYSLPLAFQFFSQEERYHLSSDSTQFTVRVVPAAGRPPDFSGAVGRNLQIERSVSPKSGRRGDTFTLDVSLRGQGNVSLWPAPTMDWPEGLRAYPEGDQDAVGVSDGRLSGTKVFRYLLVPDSAGTARLPPLRYGYFDPASRSFQGVTAPPLPIVVAPGGPIGAPRPLLPALRLDSRRPLATAVRESVPAAVWTFLVLLPPLVFGIRRIRWRRRSEPVEEQPEDPLVELSRRLDRALVRWVGDRPEGEGGIEQALTRAGLDPELAGRAADARHRLDHFRFGGNGGEGAEELANQLRDLLARLAGEPIRRRARRVVSLGLVLGFSLTHGAGGQTPEELYAAGTFQVAGDSFAARAARQPDVPAHWINLGAARYRDGADGAALVAWTEGARLLPRDPALQHALTLVPPADAGAARWLWVSPVTPDELFLLAAAAWLVGWVGAIRSRRLRGRWVVVVAAAVLIGGFATALGRQYARPVALTSVVSTLRLSPHELAPATAQLSQFAAVEVLDRRGPWRRVEDPEGRRGWIKAEVLEPLGP